MSRLVRALVVVGIIVCILLVSGIYLRSQESPQPKIEVPVASIGWNTESFSRVSVSVADDKILLDAGCYRLPIFADAKQLDSISRGIKGEIGKRPVTHEIMADSFEFFEINVVMVKITKIENSTYYARLILRRGNNILDIDSRPSDAIALAVRVNAPIYVNDSLLHTYGEKLC